MPVSRSRRTPKKPTRAAGGDSGARRTMPAHAHLIEGGQDVVGGIALRDDEWVVVLHGRPVATTESAGLAIAMLRHTAVLLIGTGRVVRVDTSETLRTRATEDATEAGKTLEEYLAFLEAERAELAREREGAPPSTQ